MKTNISIFTITVLFLFLHIWQLSVYGQERLYATSMSGGANGNGAIFSIDPASGSGDYRTDYSIAPLSVELMGGTWYQYSRIGTTIMGSLVLYNNKFYGMTHSYGPSP